MSNTFNPREHLMNIKSKQGSSEYLPVQWRLVWFRQLCPDGTIETEIIHLDLDKETEEETYVWNAEKRRSEKVIKTAKGVAIFRAIVKDGKGGVATGTKMEKAASFPDWVEKAETGSVGRALAALGYGTQFTGDELNEAHRIVDSPVDRSTATVEGNTNGNGNDHSANGNSHSINGNDAARKPAISAVRPMPTNGNGSGVRPAATPAPVTDEAEADAAATEQQLSSIRKLRERLGKSEPESPDTLSFAGAKELIGQLTQEYRSRKAS